MRIISDFRLFERAPKPGIALFRWIAWRWLLFSVIFALFVAFFFGGYHLGGEPIYYTNEDRYLTQDEVGTVLRLFLSGAGLFFVLGLAGVLFIPKR